MGEVADIGAARWQGNTDPNAHPPTAAIDALLRDIKAGEVDPLHVIIAVAAPSEKPGGSRTRYYQSGKLDFHGQLGLLTRVAQLMGVDD